MKLRYHLLATLTLALTTLLCNAMNNEEPLITEKIDEKKNLFLDNLYKCKTVDDMVRPDLESLTEQKVGEQEFIKERRKYLSKAFDILWNQYKKTNEGEKLSTEDLLQLLVALITIITITPENPTLVCDAVSLNKISDYLNTQTFDQLLNLFPLCRFLDLDKKILKKVEEAFINKTVKQLSSSPTLPNKEALNHVLEDLCVENKARLLPEPVLTVVNHNDDVNSVTFSPDGTSVATASDDKTTKIWETRTGKLLHTLNHNSGVNNVAFNHNGKLIATASWDQTAKIWETKTGKLLFPLNHDDDVNSVTFSPDGTLVATTSGNSAQLWDIETGKLIHTFNHDDDVNSVTFSPDGTLVATASSDDTAKIWDTKTGKLLFTLNHDDDVNSVTFSSDGATVVTASYDKTAKIWSVETGKCLHILNHDNWIINVTFSPNGGIIATISGNTAQLWDIETGKLIHTFNHDDLVGHIIFSPDGTLVATASNDKTTKIWETKTGKLLHTLNHNAGVNSVAFNHKGTLVATASWDQTAKIWETKTGKLLFPLNHDDIVEHVTFNHKGDVIATTSDDTAKIWRIKEDLTLAQHTTVLFLNKLKKEGKQLVFSQLNPMIANIARGLPPSIKQHYFPNRFNRTMWTFFKTCGFVKNNPK